MRLRGTLGSCTPIYVVAGECASAGSCVRVIVGERLVFPASLSAPPDFLRGPQVRIRGRENPGASARSPGLSVLVRMIAPFRSMMPQERNQDDDRNGNSNQPKQRSSSESHVDVLRLACDRAGSRTNVCWTKTFRPRTFGVGSLRRRLPRAKLQGAIEGQTGVSRVLQASNRARSLHPAGWPPRCATGRRRIPPHCPPAA